MENKKILIIDDSEGIRYTLQEICSFAEFTPILASDGKEGIQQYLTHNPDLILVDFHMPEMDGFVTVRTIRQMDKDTPIIVLTVDERQQIADKFLEIGANDFALKPIKAPDIISRMKVHLKIAELEKEASKSVNLHSDPIGGEIAAHLEERVTDDLYTLLNPILAKGISKGTIYLIAEHLAEKKEYETIEEVSEATGISYPTVHRYLNHLVENDLVMMEINYGSVGRPKNHYCWKY
ncbi:MAG: response regulator [Bacillus sp. (in: Bacteria)]|nr:response regulator [Bacillus sp. (in: firmicutes)]